MKVSRPIVIGFVVASAAIAVWAVRGYRGANDESPAADAASRTYHEYVGRDVCAECHAEQTRHFSGTGHARTFAKATGSPVAARLVDSGFTDVERDGGFRYEVRGDALQARFAPSSTAEPFPLQYAIGSGDHAVTFLTLLPASDGVPAGVEHRVSWFGHSDSPGLTPGHDGRIAAEPHEEFGLVKRGDSVSGCIACHTTTAQIDGDVVTHLRAGVGCEVCHGPGRAHVAAVEAGEDHQEMLYGGRFAELDQIQHCGRCHRTVADVPRGRVAREETAIVRFQPVGLVQSRCYTESNGELSCTTCHNPHEHASRTTRQAYDNQCVSCHRAGDTDRAACPVSAREGCVACHMPRVEFYSGIGFHDHWIRVRSAVDPPPMEPFPSVSGDPQLDER